MKEFAELYCDHCMCQLFEPMTCSLVDSARVWIRTHMDRIGSRLFEDVAKEYPGAFRPFMMAWCEEFGGI